MSSVNNILYSIQNMSPVMLSIGGGRGGANYDGLAALTNSLFGSNNSIGGNPLNSSSNSVSSAYNDRVSLTYKNISEKIVSDMASVTAGAIKEYPELDGNYVIAVIDDGTTREARVYSRAEILANFEGTEKEKKALESQLAANPLMVFNNGSGLPESSSDKANQALADKLNEFLKTNSKTLNTLDKAGYDPLADMMADSSMKKILAQYAGRQEIDEDLSGRELSKKFIDDLKELIEAKVKDNPSLKNDYVLAIIDDGVTREARVYSRSEILENFEGSDEEKEKLKKQLDSDPLMVFLNDNGLPESSESEASAYLAEAVNIFLGEKSKELDKLDKDGYDPLANLLGDSSIKKALAKYASAIEEDE